MIAVGVKEKAIILRKRGSSLKEISDRLKVSKSTASLWLRNVKLSSSALKTLEEKKQNGRKRGNARQIEKSIENVRDIRDSVTRYLRVTPFSKEQAKGFCALLYGCEGSKNETGRMAFINSDPALITFFLHLFRLAFEVNEKKFRVLMHLHQYHDEKKQKKFWSEITGIPSEQFSKTYQKPNGQKNIREGYQGCVSVRYNSASVQKELVILYREMIEQRYCV
ncbi:MAG: hypothetical protein A2878_01560 [Candidatus Moranbacteria bacterium RIFCSPHIGHO2_01_FULL_54_31]|nr:MAG: hypothetical protein A2878_01560 [Candidatus Moranbacteria bacterium RIFCSPHIGHO2_01_FULL_54_31]